MPGNLSAQIPYIKSMLEAMGLPLLEKEGFEADDIIGTVVERLKGKDTDVVIVTSDKDMMQLVSDKVKILDTMKGLSIGESEVEGKFGIKPAFMTDYLALCGDTSDNIPGVPGVGDKTARELVATFGSVDELYDHIDQVKKPALKEKLITGRDLAYMSKQLATIRLDVPIETGIEDLKTREPDLKALRKLYRELEFTALYKDIKVEGEEKKEWRRIDIASLNKRRIALLVNFHGKNVSDIQLHSFAAFDGSGILISQKNQELAEILSRAEEIITHNLKPLLIFLASQGLDAPSPRPPVPPSPSFFDTMLATYLVNPLRKDYGAISVIEEYLDMDFSSHGAEEIMTEAIPYLFDSEDVWKKMDGLGSSCHFSSIRKCLLIKCLQEWSVKG